MVQQTTRRGFGNCISLGKHLKQWALGVCWLMLGVMVSETGWGQVTVNYSGMGSVTCPAAPTAVISPTINGLTFSQISRGSGVTCSSAGSGISGSAFNVTLANAITNNKWYTYSITSNSSTPFTVTALTIQSQVSSAAGSPNVSVQYSIGGSAPSAVIGSFTPTASSVNYPITLGTAVSVGASQTLNIYIIPNGLTAVGTTCRVENNSSISVTAVTNGITLSSTPQNAGPFCNSVSNAVSLTYTTAGTVTAPFLELSDNTGSFSGSTSNIGTTVTGSGPYTISGTIPASVTAGNYRIRVKSTDATPVISADNGSNIVISSMPIALSISSAPTPVCLGSSYNYTATATGAASYNWSYSGSNTIITNGTTATATLAFAASATAGNVSVTAINGACTTAAASTPIAVNAAPANPGNPMAAANPACTSTTLNTMAYPGGVTYYWQGTNAAGTNTGLGNTSATYTANVSGTNPYYVRSRDNTSGCWSAGSGSTSVTIATATPAVPNFTAGVASPCAGTAGVTFTVNNDASASYAWTYPAGWSGNSTTNSINLTAGANSGNVSVTASNICGGNSNSYAVTPVNGVPSNPVFTASTSSNNVAAPAIGSTTLTYSISAIAGATGYTWSVAGLSGGWNITAGNGTTSITVTVGSGSGNITVYASNTCGNSSTVNFAVAPVFGTFYSQASGNPATLSNWNTVRGGGGTAPGSMTAGNFVIQNGHNMSTTGTITIGQSGNTFQIENGGTLTANNQVTIGGIMQVDNVGTYTHNLNGGTIPTATWAASSLCKVTGMTNSTPSGMGQAFGNFTWDCAQTTFFNINNAAFSVAGTLTVNNTGSSNLALVGSTTTSYTYNIANINVTGGLLNLNYFSSASGGIATVNVAGSVTVSNLAAAKLNFADGSGNPSSFTYVTKLNLGGNLTVGASGYFYLSNSGANTYSQLNFTGTTVQQVNVGTGTSTNRGYIDFNVPVGKSVQLLANLSLYDNQYFEVYGTIDLQSFAINNISGTATEFDLYSGATLITSNNAGIVSSGASGAVQTSVRYFHSAANYEFQGAATGVFTTSPTALTVNNLTINRAAGVTVNQGFTVNGTLYLTSGIATNGTNTIISATGNISGAGTANYVNGQLQMPFTSGNLSRTYPIGDATVYAPVTINFSSVSTAGGVIASTVNTAQANFSTAQIDQAKYVKRTWTLSNNGTAFSSYSATFNFVAGDIQGVANTASFWGAWFNNNWNYPAIGTRTATSTQVTGATGFGDYMVGELPTNTITTGVVTTSLCTGTAYTVPYTSTGTFSGGTFFAQLSDASGVFPAIGSNYISVSGNSGINPLPITIPSTYAAGSGYRIRIVYSKTGAHVYGSNNGSNISLAVAPAFTADPVNTTVPANSLNAYFSVTASGTIGTYQWQYYNGSTWVNVPASTPYSGTTTATLTIDGPNISTAMNGFQYRCVISGTGACTTPVTSAAATLTVTTAPCLSQLFTGYTGAASFNSWTNLGGSFYSTATSSGNSVNSYQFQATGNVLTSASLAGTGNVATSLSFWLKSSGTDATSSLLVEGFNGVTWSTIATINGTNVSPYPSGTMLTYNAGSGAWPTNAGLIQFRFTYSKSAGNLAFDDVLIYCTNGCTSPDAIAFVAQPSNVIQSQTMNTVTVKVYCSSTGILANNYNGLVTIKAPGGVNGCGLNGTTGYSASAVNGIATFNNLVFTRSAQTGIYITASAASVAGTATSNTFNVTVPSGSANTTLIAAQDFDSYTNWNYSSGSATYNGSGGGADYVGVKTFSGNKVLVKSFSIDNGSDEKSSTNTITFNNYSWTSATYDYATFKFTVGSLGAADGCASNCTTGAGADAGDDLYVETSIDGGSTWSKLLTINGYSNYLLPLSITPVTTLSYNANVTYSSNNNLSTFRVQLPGSVNQFRFRMTATNNRSNENWAIDSITLIGTKLPPGSPSLLPVITNNSISGCPSAANTISAVTSNTIGAISYLWSPATFINSTTVSNPTVNPPSTTVYSVTITDADNCTASGNVTVNIPSGASGNWTGNVSDDWFNCLNWGNGVVPDNSVNVTIAASAVNPANIDPLSSYASAFSYLAATKNIIIDNKTLSFEANAILNTAGSVLIQNNGLVDMTNGGILNLTGNWTNTTGTNGLTEGTGTIHLNSTSASQTINTTGGEVFNKLIINNTGGGVVLSTDVSVSNTLTLTNGVVTTASSPNGLLTITAVNSSSVVGGSTNSFINGPFRRAMGTADPSITVYNANAEYIFPVGKTGASNPYRPCSVYPTSLPGGPESFQAEYKTGTYAHNILGNLVGIRDDEYWQIDKKTGASTSSAARIKLNYQTSNNLTDWYPTSLPCNNCNVVIAHAQNNGTIWYDAGYFRPVLTYSTLPPFIEARGWKDAMGELWSIPLTSFSPFGFGYNINQILPLPVKLLSFTGRLQNANGKLEWKIADARDLESFDLEYSRDGRIFHKLSTIPSTGGLAYDFLHKSLPYGANFYRLLVKEKSGQHFYSPVVTLHMGKLLTYLIGIVPANNGSQVNSIVFSANHQKLQATITDVLGRQVLQASKQLAPGSNQSNFETSILPRGLYFISLRTEDGWQQISRFVKE